MTKLARSLIDKFLKPIRPDRGAGEPTDVAADLDPVYVITHERSGTHFLINTIINNFHAPEQWENLGEWFGPYDDQGTRYDHIDRFNDQWDQKMGSAKIIKSHCDRELYEARYRRLKVIYVVRDPRDTLVSFFHYFNNDNFRKYNPTVQDLRCESIAEFLRRPMTPFLKHCYSLNGHFENVTERWAAQVGGWIDQPDTLLVRYRDLKQDLESVVARVGEFTGFAPRGPVRAVGLNDAASILPRKGVIGDWQKIMTDQDSDFVRRAVEKAGIDWDRVAES